MLALDSSLLGERKLARPGDIRSVCVVVCSIAVIGGLVFWYYSRSSAGPTPKTVTESTEDLAQHTSRDGGAGETSAETDPKVGNEVGGAVQPQSATSVEAKVPAEMGATAFRSVEVGPDEIARFFEGRSSEKGDREELLIAARRGELRRVVPRADEVEVRASTVAPIGCPRWTSRERPLLVRVNADGRVRAAAFATETGGYEDGPSWILECRFRSSDRRAQQKGFLFLASPDR